MSSTKSSSLIGSKHPQARFHASAVGPQGGTRYKSGVRAAEAHFRHDDQSCRFEIVGYLVDGAPHVSVRAWRLVDEYARDPAERSQEHTFYEGPLSQVFGKPPASHETEGEDVCEDCAGAGWAVFNEDQPDDLGDIQRCDLCRLLPDDDAAWEAARRAGYGVDEEGTILTTP